MRVKRWVYICDHCGKAELEPESYVFYNRVVKRLPKDWSKLGKEYLCPKCGFYHNPSRFLSNDKGLYEVQVTYQYNYCPMCGEYLYDDIEHATCVWNERDMEELYSEEKGNKYE